MRSNTWNTRLIGAAVLLFAASTSWAAAGNGTIKLGHTFIDEEGNQSVNYRTYNTYEGTALSLEGMNYDFGDGMRATFNGRNLTLNNRHLEGTLSKRRLLGVTVTNSQYRRIYDFDGGITTRRHNTAVNAYVTPTPNIRLYGGGGYVGYHGGSLPVFSLTDIPVVGMYDYKQTFYNGGIRLNDRGRSLSGEYRGNTFTDDIDNNRNQKRWSATVQGVLPVPRYEWLKLNAAYRYFESKYDSCTEKFSAKTFWGGGTAALNENWALRYAVVFDRAGASDDEVETDNVTHAFYVTYARLRKMSLTGGYQYGVNDDYRGEVRTDGLYFSGWYAITPKTEARADVGLRAEETSGSRLVDGAVVDGARLIGDEDLGRFRASLRHRFNDRSMVKLRAENTHRENSQINAKTDYMRAGGEFSFDFRKILLSGSYTFGTGEYENASRTFSYDDHLISGDARLPEWEHLTLGGGVVYYRNKGDLDAESVSMRFSVDYALGQNYMVSAKYTGENFDDLTKLYGYYTANIFEITIARDISF